MDKHQIAAALAQIAELLELKGENPFKVRAYENAARVVEGLTEGIGPLIERGGLTEIKGIGRNLAEHITELAKTGRLKEYEKMRASIPEGVIAMLSVSGLGPKRVRFLWEKLKIKTLGELEMAAKRHMLAGSPGFGEKMEEKILAGIETIKKFSGKRLYAEAFDIANRVHGEITKWPEVGVSEVAGSIRRKKEIIKDIDILVATEKPKEVMERFAAMASVERVLEHGKTKSVVILKSGMQCDLRAVTLEEYPFALHYFTGSKEHNVAMRGMAKRASIKMNEYGLFRDESKKTIPCKDETAIFRTFGLDFIEPELREDMGEIAAAAAGKLPKLIERENLKGILHAHTAYTDGEGTIEEMALAARKLNFEYLAVCDHSQALSMVHGLKPADARHQHKEIDALNKRLKGFTILKGIEVDILSDGALDFDDELLATFDVVIAAVHSRFGMKEEEMTKRILKAVSNPNVDILAHPTGRLLLAREPYAVDLRQVIDAAAKYETAIEINAHPQRLDLDWKWCKYAKERGVKLAICPDAHSAEGLSDVQYGINVARKGWLEKQDVLNCLPAEQLIGYFRK